MYKHSTFEKSGQNERIKLDKGAQSHSILLVENSSPMEFISKTNNNFKKTK